MQRTSLKLVAPSNPWPPKYIQKHLNHTPGCLLKVDNDLSLSFCSWQAKRLYRTCLCHEFVWKSWENAQVSWFQPRFPYSTGHFHCLLNPSQIHPTHVGYVSSISNLYSTPIELHVAMDGHRIVAHPHQAILQAQGDDRLSVYSDIFVSIYTWIHEFTHVYLFIYVYDACILYI